MSVVDDLRRHWLADRLAGCHCENEDYHAKEFDGMIEKLLAVTDERVERAAKAMATPTWFGATWHQMTPLKQYELRVIARTALVAALKVEVK